MISELTFEWDPEKARTNALKHGVSFDEAKTVFADAGALHLLDGPHSWEEDRFIIIGRSDRRRILFVAYVERTELTMRLISARRAMLHERRIYEEKAGG